MDKAPPPMTDIKGLVERLTKHAKFFADDYHYDGASDLAEAAAFLTCLAELGGGLETTFDERKAAPTWRAINGDSPFMSRLLRDLDRLLLANVILTERIASLHSYRQKLLDAIPEARALLNPGPGDTTNG